MIVDPELLGLEPVRAMTGKSRFRCCGHVKQTLIGSSTVWWLPDWWPCRDY